MSAMPPEAVDLDIGDGHFLKYFGIREAGVTFGAVIWHPLPPGKPDFLGNGWCACSVIFDVPATATYPEPKWQLTSEVGPKMIISPSIMCGCGDHGFIRNGKWVRA